MKSLNVSKFVHVGNVLVRVRYVCDTLLCECSHGLLIERNFLLLVLGVVDSYSRNQCSESIRLVLTVLPLLLPCKQRTKLSYL